MSKRRYALPLGAVTLGVAVALATPATAATKTTKKKTPIKIAFMQIETGPAATANRNDALNLAVSQLNAKGGMDGHPIEITIYDAGTTGDQALTAAKKAISDNPDIAMGFSVSVQVQATAQLFDQAGIPLLHKGQLPALTFSEAKFANMYRLNVPTDKQAKSLTRYAIETLKVKKVGLLHSTDTNSAFGGKLIDDAFKAAGVEVVKREIPSFPTDVTEAVLAFKGVELAVFWGFPQTSALFIKQRAQNGLNVPQLDSAGGGPIAAGTLGNTPDQLKGYTSISACDGDMVKGKLQDAYRRDYIKANGQLDDGSQDPTNYDGIYYINAVVKKAKSTDKKALAKALAGGVSYTGVCGTLKPNAEHDLLSTMYIISADGGAGNKKIAATYTDL